MTVDSADSVGVDIACSDCTVVTDDNGVNRLSNALHIVQARLSNIVTSTGKMLYDRSINLDIPDPMQWTVTVWYFGADALDLYTDEKFYVVAFFAF